MASSHQVLRGGANPGLIDVPERDGSARLREGLGRCQAHARGGASNKRDFVFER